jgi:phospholipid/cholesterol/gamma-HCH transport system permease protein
MSRALAATRSAAGAPQGHLEIARPSTDAAVLRMSGSWTLRSTRPQAADVERELGGGSLRHVSFDARRLAEWDSAALTFLVELLESLHEGSVEVDLSGLPPGVQRLLSLAEAVPEKKVGRRGPPPPWLARLGEAALRVWDGAREFLAFVGETTLAFLNILRLRARVPVADVWLFIQNTGPQALPIVTLISFLVGLILAFVGAVQLQQFGATIYVANLVQIGMAREMGAIMTGVIMAGRTGAAFAAQIGTMKVTEEIDALTTLGLKPVEYLVVPRVIALTVMMPLLCVYSDIIGIIGGAVVGVGLLDQNFSQYVRQTLYYATITQFAIGIVKSFIFGILIALSGCLRGMQCGSSASAVGDAATSAVVTSIVLLVVADGIFAVICNALNI